MILFEKLQQNDKLTISPLDPDYTGPYPALIRITGIGESVVFANRKTGLIYPIDSKSGRQVSKLKNGRKAGRYIEKNGIPYGTYEYTVTSRTSYYIKAKQKALASGNEQTVLITEKGVTYG
jgi:hypothetical protein